MMNALTPPTPTPTTTADDDFTDVHIDDENEVFKLVEYVKIVTRAKMQMAVFDDNPDGAAARAGLPLPLVFKTPQVFLDHLPRLDLDKHVVVRSIVCITPHHKRLMCIACNLMGMGVCLVRRRRKRRH